MSAPIGAAAIRAAVAADAPVLDEITLDAEAAQGSTVAPGVNVPYLGHLIARGRVAVAEIGGRPVGFGAAVRTGRGTHLADLFVRPEVQGRGIGGRLLAEVFGDDWPRTTFGSDDPRALPLYLRAGMQAYWPNLYLSGDPNDLPPPAADLSVEPVSVPDVAALEARWIGVDRAADLDYWASLPDVRPFVIRRGGPPVGCGIGRARFGGPGRWMARAVVAPDADPLSILLAAMGAGLAGASVGGGCIPGASPLVRVLLDAGFRIVDRDTFLASDPAILDPTREIVNTGVL